MSRTRLLCRFIALACILAPTVSFAQSTHWMAIAAATWNAADGRAMVATGFSGAQLSGQNATSVALAECQSAGGQGCQAYGPWNSGCAYVLTGSSNSGVGWWAGPTVAGIQSQCSAAGMQCSAPIGGCLR
jgi:hypothetical protein